MAMDIGYKSTEERNELMRRGACFICKMIRHLSRDCPQKKKRLYMPPQTSNTPQKMKGKGLSSHIWTLLAQMEDADKEENFDDTAKLGF